MPLTAQETAEVLKVVQASKSIQSAVVKLAAIIRTTPTGGDFVNKASLTFILNPGIETLYKLQVAAQNLLWVFEQVNQRIARAENLKIAWAQIDFAVSQLRQSATRAKTIPQFASAGEDFEDAADMLSGMNRTLAYGGDNPFPPSYPKIVGPHGDYDQAQAQVALSAKYLLDAGQRAFLMFASPTWPNTAKANYAAGEIYEHFARAWCGWNRVMCLQGGVVLPEDAASAEFDHQASSGLRPTTFFHALIAHEIAMSRTKSKVFSGRDVPVGIAFNFRTIMLQMSVFLGEIATVEPAKVTKELLDGGGIYVTMPIAWAALDHWSQANLGFYFAISGPPVVVDPDQNATIPAGFFSAQSAALDAVSANAQSIAAQAAQIKADLLAKEGTQI